MVQAHFHQGNAFVKILICRKFYERTILCNSLVWSCSITDKPNLTYQEALDCEKSARKRLSNFPISIQVSCMSLKRHGLFLFWYL